MDTDWEKKERQAKNYLEEDSVEGAGRNGSRSYGTKHKTKHRTGFSGAV